MRAAPRVILAQESVVHGADQFDGYVLEVVSPEPVLTGMPAHLLAPGTEAVQDVQMPRSQGLVAIGAFEGVRRNEEIPVELSSQTPEQAVQRVDVLRSQDIGKAARATARGTREFLGEDDFPVFQPSDEHGLDEQCLCRIGGQIGVVAKQAVRRGEIIEKHLVDALTGAEVLGVRLPETTGFDAVDDFPEHQSVTHGVESRN